MKVQYHRQITLEALSLYFHKSALAQIICANLGQDALRYQLGHDHFHYDNNAFAAGDAYIDELRHFVLVALEQADVVSARESFGRLTHTVQDFYAHSNYVSLWRQQHPETAACEIEPVLPELLQNSRLCSGRLYYPLEALSFVAILKPLVVPLLPRDSHAWMSMDEPGRPGFEYAFAAAVKRTGAEYLDIAEHLTEKQIVLFAGNTIK